MRGKLGAAARRSVPVKRRSSGGSAAPEDIMNSNRGVLSRGEASQRVSAAFEYRKRRLQQNEAEADVAGMAPGGGVAGTGEAGGANEAEADGLQRLASAASRTAMSRGGANARAKSALMAALKYKQQKQAGGGGADGSASSRLAMKLVPVEGRTIGGVNYGDAADASSAKAGESAYVQSGSMPVQSYRDFKDGEAVSRRVDEPGDAAASASSVAKHPATRRTAVRQRVTRRSSRAPANRVPQSSAQQAEQVAPSDGVGTQSSAAAPAAQHTASTASRAAPIASHPLHDALSHRSRSAGHSQPLRAVGTLGNASHAGDSPALQSTEERELLHLLRGDALSAPPPAQAADAAAGADATAHAAVTMWQDACSLSDVQADPGQATQQDKHNEGWQQALASRRPAVTALLLELRRKQATATAAMAQAAATAAAAKVDEGVSESEAGETGGTDYAAEQAQQEEAADVARTTARQAVAEFEAARACAKEQLSSGIWGSGWDMLIA